jgi:hypothetical protein
MAETIRSRFLDKYLDPVSSLGEILFGIIMTLTFTLAAGIMVREEGREGARELLIATIGCNVAWGIIDAALYVLGEVFDRGRRRRLMRTVQEAPDVGSAVSHVAGELDELLAAVTDAAERGALYQKIAARLRSSEVPPVRVTRADLAGGFASFWLVFVASLPAAIRSCSWTTPSWRCAPRTRCCSRCSSRPAGCGPATRSRSPGSPGSCCCWVACCWSGSRSRSAADGHLASGGSAI